MKTILNVSRLHKNELLSVLQMLPDDPSNQFIISGYRIINPDISRFSRDVTVQQYESELAEYQIKHANDFEPPGITILKRYTKPNVLDPVITDNIKIIDAVTVPAEVSNEYDLILIGISDTGVNIFRKGGTEVEQYGISQYSQLQSLSNFRDAGVPIIFTHDCLEVNSYAEPFPPDYEELVGNFGVDSWQTDYETFGNQIQNIECEMSEHPIITSYFNLPSLLEVQPTHSGGLTLKSDANIIYREQSRPVSKSNYYLATYEVPGKGTVVFCQMGHCFGEFNQFFRPSIDECKILVNAIVWLLQ